MVSQQPTVCVVDDDCQVRESLAALIQSTDLHVACYATGRQFLDSYRPERPGCVVLDLRLPQLSGLQVLDEMAARHLTVPVIMISGHGDIRAAVSAMKAGAIDFLEKPYRGSALLESIRRAIELDICRRRTQAANDQLRMRFDTLTPQEQEVLRLTMAGKTDKAIALKLDLSLRTVQLRRTSIMRKVGVRTRTELICLVQEATGPLR